MPDQAEHAKDMASAALPLTVCSKCRQTFTTPSLWLAHAVHCNPVRYQQVVRHLQQLPAYCFEPALTPEDSYADYPG